MYSPKRDLDEFEFVESKYFVIKMSIATKKITILAKNRGLSILNVQE